MRENKVPLRSAEKKGLTQAEDGEGSLQVVELRNREEDHQACLGSRVYGSQEAVQQAYREEEQACLAYPVEEVVRRAWVGPSWEERHQPWVGLQDPYLCPWARLYQDQVASVHRRRGRGVEEASSRTCQSI